MTNEFLKKEIEEVEKEELWNYNDILYAIKVTKKECQEKHKKFVEKLKERLMHIRPWEPYKVELEIDKLSSEDLE